MEKKQRYQSKNAWCHVNENLNLDFGIIIDLYVSFRKEIYVIKLKLRHHGNIKTA